MADSDKQFRISILIDGTEQAVKTTGETKQAFDDLAKTIGTASSSGGSGLTQNVTALQKATEAQAKASGISYEALKKETEALKENSKAKRENADAAGEGSSGRSVLSAKDQAALDVRDFNAVVEAAEKKAADLAAKTGTLRQSAGEAAKAFGEIAGSIPGLEGVGKSLAKLENPIGLIIETAKFARDQVADLLDKFKDADAEGYEQFAKTNGALIALIHPIDEAKKTFREFVNWVTDGSYTVMDDLKASRQRADEMKKKLEELKEARRKEKEEYQDKIIQDRLIAETREIDNQSAAYDRLKGVRKAEDSAAEAEAKQRDKEALDAGADAFTVESGAVQRHADQRFAKLEEEVRDAYEEAEAAKERADVLSSALDDKRHDGHTSAKELEAMQRDVDRAENERDNANEALKAAKQEASAGSRGIVADAKGEFEEVRKENKENLEDQQKDISAEIKKDGEQVIEAVTRQIGDQMSDSTARSLAKIQEYLHDTVADGEQAQKIAELIAGISQDKAMRDHSTLKLLTDLQSDTLSKGQQFATLTRQMDMLVSQTKANQIALETMAKNQENLRRMIGTAMPAR